MVTKQPLERFGAGGCSVLAKILMVTKLLYIFTYALPCSVLAKILMVTKPVFLAKARPKSSVLAKILMVTKPQKYGSTFLNVIEY